MGVEWKRNLLVLGTAALMASCSSGGDLASPDSLTPTPDYDTPVQVEVLDDVEEESPYSLPPTLMPTAPALPTATEVSLVSPDESEETVRVQRQEEDPYELVALLRAEEQPTEQVVESDELPLVTYCRDNLNLLLKYYPEHYVKILSENPDGALCVKGPAPPDTIFNEVPYFNQCSFPSLDKEKEICVKGCYYSSCSSGCGPAAMKMALAYTGLEEEDYYDLWGRLWTGSISGTSADSIERVLSEAGVFGGRFMNLDWEAMRDHLERGHLIHLNIRVASDKSPPYQEERYCGENCPEGGHHLLIVGMSEDELILHDTYSGFKPEFHEFGENLVVRRETLEQRIYLAWNPMMIIVPPWAQEQQPVQTPEGAFFHYFPTAWPHQRGKEFGDNVWWQWRDFHNGTDFLGHLGDDIYAMRGGTVVGVGCLKCTDYKVAKKGYGLTVALYHGEIGGKPLYTSYSHLSEAFVELGQEVSAGDVIGGMGNTGFSIPEDRYHTHTSTLRENPFDDLWDNYDSDGQFKWLDLEIFLGMRDPPV